MVSYEEVPTTSIAKTRREQWYQEVERKVRAAWRKTKKLKKQQSIDKADKVAKNVTNFLNKNLFDKYY